MKIARMRDLRGQSGRAIDLQGPGGLGARPASPPCAWREAAMLGMPLIILHFMIL
jgi:hypothetical protein